MKLTVSQRAKAAAIYDCISGDGNKLEEFIYQAVGERAALEDLVEILRKTRCQGELLAALHAAFATLYPPTATPHEGSKA